jgi:DnaJ-class molecular chaperone
VHLPTGKELDIKIPAGLSDGQQIRLKGQGFPGGGVPGDAIVTVHIATPYFERKAPTSGRLPITASGLGGKVRVPTSDGAVELAIRQYQRWTYFRLKEKACRQAGQRRSARNGARVLPEADPNSRAMESFATTRL